MRKPRKVSEPVQVYLGAGDLKRLTWLVEHLDATKSEVLRKGLVALEDQLVRDDPLMKLIEIADREVDGGPRVDYDVVIHHDRAIADHVERESERWDRERGRRRAKPAARRRRG